MKSRNCGIILAAGKGKRMGGDIPKQFCSLKGKPVLCHTLDVFDKSPLITLITVVISSENIKYYNELVHKKYNFSTPIKLVYGGAERQESVYKALLSLEDQCDIAIIHDGVRPFVTVDIIESTIKASQKYDGGAAGVELKDTIKTIDREGFIINTPDRKSLIRIQTPQSFKYNTILKAHKYAIEKSLYATDDSMLVEQMGGKVKLTKGSFENIKITTPEDFITGEQIIKKRKSDV